MDTDSDREAAVYGRLYDSALEQMTHIEQAIMQQEGIGFESKEELERWAKEHNLDIVCLGKMQHQFFFISHRGVILTKLDWHNYYDNLLFLKQTKKDKVVQLPWEPIGLKYYNNARSQGERSADGYEPLVHRDYNVPTNYYDPTRNTFNKAKPFPVFAKETGRDTSHIYRYIEAIAGVCNLHLLAWLRQKMISPTVKTEVTPIFVSKTQGTGKTTFAEVICKGLFGKDNVRVTDQFDANSRFNADVADALIVCMEEKDDQDKRNTTASIKSRTTGTEVRKENKGLDPIFQDSYTEFISTSNQYVVMRFDGQADQRRFMVMEAKADFTRDTSDLANEVFTKLYGTNKKGDIVGTPFVQDLPLIAQFKHELYTDQALIDTVVKDFPKTDAYHIMCDLPRGVEAVNIEMILRALVPFIQASLLEFKTVYELTNDKGEMLKLSSIINAPTAMQYIPAAQGKQAFVALCLPLVFSDPKTNGPYAHATIERVLLDCSGGWLLKQDKLHIMPNMAPLVGGFAGITSRYRMAEAARIIFAEDIIQPDIPKMANQPSIPVDTMTVETGRIGTRMRVNSQWRPDLDGEFETVNEMQPGTLSLKDKSQHVQYMDTFVFEADECSSITYAQEQSKLAKAKLTKGHISANVLYTERLRVQIHEGERLFKEGKVCRIVYSGSKSYHMLVRISDPPTTLEQYKWIHGYLCTTLSDKLLFDPACADPARLTRAPVTVRRVVVKDDIEVVGMQQLRHVNWSNVLDLNWRTAYAQWQNRPMYEYEMAKGRRLRPCKKEYQDAMYSLLKGTFWTEPTWNGRRQQCFFPGYRLCRMLGYTHDELWAEGGILSGLENYYKRNEVSYWTSRVNCDLVKVIDTEVDQELEDV